MSKATSHQDNPQRMVTRGESIARRAVEYLEGNLQSHKYNLEKAVKLRREGRELGAARELLGAHERQARKVVDLVQLVGIDGSAYIYGVVSLPQLDKRRANEWLRRRRIALSASHVVTGEDRQLPFFKALLYRITGGPKAGACYELYLFHRASVEHYAKMLEEAQFYLQHARENDARELLCHERDRCFKLSFLPGETLDPLM